jgi:acetyl esterase/lipase
MAQAEAEDRSRRSLEQRLRISGIKQFKPVADYDWTWPTKIERDVIERALSLDFLPEARNVVFIGPNGVGRPCLPKILSHRGGGWLLGDVSFRARTVRRAPATNPGRTTPQAPPLQ